MAAPIPLPALAERRGGLLRFLVRELLPKGKLLTPFNVISSVIMVATAVILWVRFTQGLGAVSNLDQRFPWGLWKGFNVVAGVALAGGAYVTTFLVYIFKVYIGLFAEVMHCS